MNKKITLLFFTIITSVIYAQTTIADSPIFDAGPNATWTHVFVAVTTSDGQAVSAPAQTVVINITSLPEPAKWRVYKTTSNGTNFYANALDLELGVNTITVAAVNFNRAVKFQFSKGSVEFDSFSYNGSILYPCSDSTIAEATNVFDIKDGDDVNWPDVEWPYSLTLATIDDGNNGEVHEFAIDISCLPVGGAQYRILKTGPNGDINCCTGNLSLGLNTKNVSANGGWPRNIKFWFSSGDVNFSSVTSNGSPLGLQQVNSALIKIYPNPASNVLTISGVNNIDSVKVYSILGRLEKEVFNTQQIEISDLASGIYFVKVSNGSNVISKKFIKQ
jgi:hypothetical protein